MANELKISKSYTFDAAHQLEGHNGKCARLHGHTYQVNVWLKGPQSIYGSSHSMVVDYFDLDAIVKPIIEMLDHRFICNGIEPAVKAIEAYEEYDADTRDWFCFLPVQRTTAEELAKWFAHELLLKMPENVIVYGVQVCETPKTMAEYIQVMPQGETV